MDKYSIGCAVSRECRYDPVPILRRRQKINETVHFIERLSSIFYYIRCDAGPNSVVDQPSRYCSCHEREHRHSDRDVIPRSAIKNLLFEIAVQRFAPGSNERHPEPQLRLVAKRAVRRRLSETYDR